VTVEDRKASALVPTIKAHTAPGSVIRSDCWKIYDILPFQAGFDHLHEKVNHSKEFVTDKGTHTNTMEGTWCEVKQTTPVRKRNKTDLPGCLLEFVWRRRNEGNLWNVLLRALREVFYEDAQRRALLKWSTCAVVASACVGFW
jgi:hypothetical protein